MPVYHTICEFCQRDAECPEAKTAHVKNWDGETTTVVYVCLDCLETQEALQQQPTNVAVLSKSKIIPDEKPYEIKINLPSRTTRPKKKRMRPVSLFVLWIKVFLITGLISSVILMLLASFGSR